MEVLIVVQMIVNVKKDINVVQNHVIVTVNVPKLFIINSFKKNTFDFYLNNFNKNNLKILFFTSSKLNNINFHII